MPGYIEKRGEDSYRLVVSSGYGTGGKRKKYTRTIKVTGKTEPERRKKCKKELAKFIGEIEIHSFIQPSKLTFSEFAKKWLEDYAEKNLAPKTIFRYKEMLESRILPALGHIKISKLKPIHFIEFYNNLTEDGIRKDNKKGGLSTRTIKHHHTLIHAILETAVKWEIIEKNPVDNVTPPKVAKSEAKFYNEYEVKLLLSKLDTLNKEHYKYKVGITITVFGGLRLGELMGLTWKKINFSKNTIEIAQANQYLPKKGTFTKAPKNDSSKRVIYLPEEIMKEIKKYKSYQLENKLNLGDKWIDTNFLFTQWNGLPMHPYTMSKWFDKFLEKNNLKKITFHQLRHTSATLLINSGVNIREVSARLGHSNASTTLNIYSHSLVSADKDAADKLEKFIFKSDTKSNRNEI